MKKLSLKPAAFLLAGLLVAATAAQAQQAAPQPDLTPEHFAQLDRNKSGGITKDEYEQFMRESFQKMDKDGNQRLTPNETVEVITTEQFGVVDANKDGTITLDEFIEHVMRDFDRYDYDKDGKLTK